VTDQIVVIDRVAKRFGDVVAVDDLSFTVEQGQICGLLGPNGAGKTTTLRILAGLQRPSSGEARLFGERVEASCPQLLRVGALIEQAAFVPHLTGMRNLRLWWEATGARMADADLDTALGIADLGGAINRRVGTYSQGMKQRLGFARLLLGRPELLMIDEPTNGLDPGEIREVREMIRRLAEEGRTILMSSHHLSEVEIVCTQAVVMNHGRLVTAGPVRDIIGSSGAVYVEVDDRERAHVVLAAVDGVTRVAPQGDGLVVQLRSGDRADLAEALVGAGLRLATLAPSQGLEEAFLDLLEREDGAASAAVPGVMPVDSR
jgi:ABC-2 type transport system ATP-binding protein